MKRCLSRVFVISHRTVSHVKDFKNLYLLMFYRRQPNLVAKFSHDKCFHEKHLVVHKANNNSLFHTNCFRKWNKIIGIVNKWTVLIPAQVWSHTKQTHGLVGKVSTMWHTDSLFITAEETKGNFSVSNVLHYLFSLSPNCFEPWKT